MKYFAITLASLAATALAKTDLEGCTSSETVVYGGASLVYWDPTNGEICSFLDCGGGRAPPKTTVPGCPQYAGTASYSPDFLPGWGSATPTPSAAAESSAQGSASAEVFSEVSSEAPAATSEGASTLITSAAILPSVTGTGSGSFSSAPASGANNVTGSATLSTATLPEATGAAARFGVAQGVVGVMAGVFGLALL